MQWDAAKTMLKVAVFMIVVILISFVPIGILFKILKWSPLAAFIIAIFIAWTIKFAFLDSYILCQTMTGYMELAPNTQITFDLYSKLCGISNSFKKLYGEGQKENPKPAYEAVNNVNTSHLNTNEEKPIYCGKCGAKNVGGSGFCGSCGAKL